MLSHSQLRYHCGKDLWANRDGVERQARGTPGLVVFQASALLSSNWINLPSKLSIVEPPKPRIRLSHSCCLTQAPAPRCLVYLKACSRNLDILRFHMRVYAIHRPEQHRGELKTWCMNNGDP